MTRVTLDLPRAPRHPGSWWADRLDVARGNPPDDFHAGCPACGSRDNLHVTDGTDGALIKCFTGCEYADILEAMAEDPAGGAESPPNGRNVRRRDDGAKGTTAARTTPPKAKAKVQNPLAWLAAYCGVDEDWLRKLPLGERKHQVAFLFGAAPAVKLRDAGTKEYQWDGSPAPHLWPMPADPIEEEIIVTEGETDCIVLRAAGYDQTYGLTKGASGAPGSAVWAQLRARGLRRVLLLFDEDQAGRDGRAKVAAAIREGGVDVAPARVIGLDALAGEKDARDVWHRAHDIEVEAIGGWRDDHVVTAAELTSMQLDPLVYVVENLISSGTTILAGAPKLGKSWLAYQFAVEVALGGLVIGKDVRKGAVRYYALEDGYRRGQNRLLQVLDRRPSPRNLEVVFSAPKIGEGLEQDLVDWLDRAKEPSLVIIDTLQRVRPPSSGRRNMYEVDVEDLARIQDVFRDTDVAIVVVHHTRKARGDDLLERISGTFGLPGTADTNLVLQRPRMEALGTLYVSSRDGAEQDLSLHFDPTRPRDVWAVSSVSASAGRLSRRVADVLHRANHPMHAKEIADELGDGTSRESVARVVRDLLDDGEIIKTPRGYQVPLKVTKTRREEDLT